MNEFLNNGSACSSHPRRKRGRKLAQDHSRRGISMSKRVTTARVAACAIAGVFALAGAAHAQPYGYNGVGANTYSYDPCKREQTQRGAAGALVGGGLGAVIGSNAAARNARTEGALLGGLLGAVIGGTVGNQSAACTSTYANSAAPPPPPPTPTATGGYYERDYYDRQARRDAEPAADEGFAYGRRGERYRLAQGRPDAEGCTLAESPIYMPDGRVQTRFVRVCRDSTGRYAVVD
jgi:hypothetical protein